MAKNVEYWVATYYEKTVVFDTTVQIPTPNFVLLWDFGDKRMYRYAKSFARKRLRPIQDEHAFHLIINRYLEWLTSRGHITEDSKRALWETASFYGVSKEFLSQITLSGKHEFFLSGLGIRFQGTRPTSGIRPRIAYCWLCHSSLDNSINIECVACSWILCSCGACGCGYSK